MLSSCRRRWTCDGAMEEAVPAAYADPQCDQSALLPQLQPLSSQAPLARQRRLPRSKSSGVGRSPAPLRACGTGTGRSGVLRVLASAWLAWQRGRWTDHALRVTRARPLIRLRHAII